MPKIKTLAALIVAGFAVCANAHAAKLKVYPVIVETEQARATINIVNEGSEPITLEAAANIIKADTEIGVFPPVATVPPGKKQVFRLIVPKAADTTQYWRVKIGEVKEKAFGAAGEVGAVQNELAFEIPVFSTPKGATPNLVHVGNKVENKGNRHVLITDVGGKNTHVYLMPGDSIDAAPGARVSSMGRELQVN